VQARTARETSHTASAAANAISPVESCAKIRCAVWSTPRYTSGRNRFWSCGASCSFQTSSRPIAPSTPSPRSASAIDATNIENAIALAYVSTLWRPRMPVHVPA